MTVEPRRHRREASAVGRAGTRFRLSFKGSKPWTSPNARASGTRMLPPAAAFEHTSARLESPRSWRFTSSSTKYEGSSPLAAILVRVQFLVRLGIGIELQLCLGVHRGWTS